VIFLEDFDEKAMIDRINLLRKQYAGARGKSRFAKALGISPSTYNYYENDRIPPINIILRICELTGADLEWVLTGRHSEKKFAFGPNAGLLRELDALLGTNPELFEPIAAFVELLREKKGIEKELRRQTPPSKPRRPGWIPVLGRTAAGMIHFWDQTFLPEPKQAVTELDELVQKHTGKEIARSVDGTVTIDLRVRPLMDNVTKRQVNLVQVSTPEQQEVVEFLECEEIHRLFADSFALQIDGDSMSPRINDGDIVILSPSVPAAQGQIGVARIANQIGVTCKLIRTTKDEVHLIPINERYETKVIAKKDLLWALAVLCHVSI
jgi:transcriptional regulator with XRE-family HTH domain